MRTTVPLLACLAVLAGASPARAAITAPLSPQVRVALAEAIVLGKVTAIEPAPVAARTGRGAGKKVNHRVAVVQVEEVLLGKKQARVRVGSVRPDEVKGDLVPYALDLPVGRAGCFVLARHAEADFLVVLAVGGARANVLDRRDKDYAKAVAALRRPARLLQGPEAGLRSKTAADRLLTAGMLIVRYRTLLAHPDSTGDTEPVEAGQSKLILQALAEADWEAGGPLTDLAPVVLFVRLGLTEKDGWKSPEGAGDVAAAAKKWLREHAGSYRIRRYVPDKSRKG
jgi:hypothetical protein